MPECVRKRVIVHGRVQGVWFRVTTQEAALKAGVGGWVRNLADGSVEAVFEGPEGAVEEMLAWSRSGPPHAYVESLDISDEPAEGLKEFEIR